MRGKNIACIVLLVVGIVVLLVLLTADLIGIGGWPSFVWKQIVGTILGVVVIVVGLTLMPKRIKIV